MTDTIRYTEIFKSFQGEGLHQGVPSLFIRTFGCPLRCPGFSLPKGSPYENAEVAEVIKNIDQYKTLEELPLVHTGCDSYPAIYPQFKYLSKTATAAEMAEIIRTYIPVEDQDRTHLVITGGEPLLPKWQRFWSKVFENYHTDIPNNVTFETNGTQEIIPEFKEILIDFGAYITVSASVKLSSSGESYSKRINTFANRTLYECADNFYFKFVVSAMEDFDEIEDLFKKDFIDFSNSTVYIMPSGGTDKYYQQNKNWVAVEALKRGYCYSQRLHLDLFGNQWNT